MNNMNSQADLRAAHINYTNLDVAKFVCALLVVFIHTDPLRGVSEIAGFYLKDVLARVAVPLFLRYPVSCFFADWNIEMTGSGILPGTGVVL